jgi:hypothetical protein
MEPFPGKLHHDFAGTGALAWFAANGYRHGNDIIYRAGRYPGHSYRAPYTVADSNAIAHTDIYGYIASPNGHSYRCPIADSYQPTPTTNDSIDPDPGPLAFRNLYESTGSLGNARHQPGRPDLRTGWLWR